MLPIKIDGYTRQFGPPDNWDGDTQGECGMLAVLDVVDTSGSKIMISAWKPNEEEIKAINEGKPVYLWIYGALHPVVSLSVEGIQYDN